MNTPWQYSVDNIKQTVKLLKEYESQKVLCASEFIDSKNFADKFKDVSALVICMIKHQFFFDKLLEHFWEQNQLKKTNKWTLEILLYLLIFVFSEEKYDEIKCAFLNIQYKFPLKIVQFLLLEENLMLCARIGCKYFDKDYVLANVLHPLLNNEKLLVSLERDLLYELNERTAVMPKRITVPVTPNVFRKKTLQTPVDSQASKCNFHAKEVPNFRKQNEKMQASLIETKKKNWDKAKKLLEEAQTYAFKCASSMKKEVKSDETENYAFKSKKAPNFKTNIPIKKTNACLMREAAVLVKNRENELNKLQNLLTGAFDDSKLELIEEEFRKCREQQNLQDIERKHLQGLLTFEEAQLAKKKLLRINQEKMEKFKEDRVTIMQEIFDWKEREREKIKGLVQKCHDIEKSAKEAEKRLKEEKQCRAKLIDYESKTIANELHQRREQELMEKANLIKELRALHQLRTLNTKEFDPTECPNFGLLCEMSIAELRERLNIIKIEMQEELEERKRMIAEERNRKDQLLDSIKEFISQSRVCTVKAERNVPLKMEEPPDILCLREKLQQAREMNAEKYSNYK